MIKPKFRMVTISVEGRVGWSTGALTVFAMVYFLRRISAQQPPSSAGSQPQGSQPLSTGVQEWQRVAPGLPAAVSCHCYRGGVGVPAGTAPGAPAVVIAEGGGQHAPADASRGPGAAAGTRSRRCAAEPRMRRP